MRTTLIIDDSVYQRAKVAAAERGVTVASVVEEALQLMLNRRTGPAPADLGPMPLDSQMSRARPGLDLNDSRALREAMDDDLGADVLR